MNLRSINNKLEEIQHLITSSGSLPDILVFTETWIKDIDVDFFGMNGFTPFILGRSNRRGRGVAILTKCDSCTSRLLEKIMTPLIEVIVVQINTQNDTFTVVAIYRPPLLLNKEDQEIYLQKLDYILNKYANRNSIIIGDQNINILNEENEFVKSYVDVFLQYNQVFQNKNIVTRPVSGSCIDHIITDYEIVERIQVQTLQFMNLDHLVLFIDIPLKTPKLLNKQPSYFVYKQIDYENVNSLLPMRLAHINEMMSTNEIFDELISGIKNTVLQCTKIKVIKRKIKYKSDWMDSELIKLIDEKEYWYKRKTEARNLNQFYNEKYVLFRNKVTSMKRKKREIHFGHKLERCNGDMKKTWNFMKDAMNNGQHSKNETNLFSNLQDKTAKQEKLDEYNDFYSRIGDSFVSTQSNFSNEIPLKFAREGSSFEFKRLSMKETRQIIMNLKNKNSTGFDDISPKFVKQFCDELNPFVNILINKSLESGIFPYNAKLARVIGIFKGGDSNDVSNFRPISQISIIGKLIEAAVDIQLSQYLIDNDLLSKEQYGFRNSSNTLSTCFDLTTSVCNKRDNNQLTCLTFIDTQKAFNSVDREILLKKLRNLGFHDITYEWFRSFLSNTRQFSECQTMKSKITLVKTGLMQGSILSPKLFNIYSCDLNLMCFTGKFYAYADDLCFEHSSNDVDELKEIVTRDLCKFESYMNFNRLSVNVNKTQYMIIGRTNQIVEVRYAGKMLEKVDKYKYLGLIMNDTLTWKDHVKKISRNLSALAGVFKKVCNIIPNHLKKSLYNSMFVSNILYCLPIYGCTTNENIIFLQRIQNRALKNLYNKDRFYSPRNLLLELQYPSVMNYFRLYSMIHVHAIKINKIHSNTMITEREHRYETRNKELIWRPHIHTMRWGDNNPLNRAVFYYNELDQNMKSISDIKRFKKSVNDLLLSM